MKKIVALLLAAMMLAVVVPLYNVSAVILLEHFSGKKHSPLSMVKETSSTAFT